MLNFFLLHTPFDGRSVKKYETLLIICKLGGKNIDK
jgi:hypothetical protein